jgi:hypothetical protein
MQIGDLQSLIELGSIRDKIEVNGRKFGMRTLNAMERMSLANFLGDKPNAEKLFEFNIKLLAMAIEDVDGQLLENFHTNLDLDPIERKQDLLRVMQSPVLGRLLEFYNQLTKRCDSQFDIEEIKN